MHAIGVFAIPIGFFNQLTICFLRIFFTMRLISKFLLLVLHTISSFPAATNSFLSPRKIQSAPIILSFFFLIFFCQPIECRAVTLTWSANDPIENVTGYKIYYGSASGQYDGHYKDVGNVTSCEIEEVIATLEEGKTYYLAATAYSATAESGYSSEVVYTHATVLKVVADTVISDTDGDGISDEDELYLYGTDPINTDSDNDGISDDKELAYWGTLWNEDFDGDGIANLTDWDSDGDGVSDGDEVSQGTDPATPQLIVTLLSPVDGATLPAGDITFSCQATSQGSDIDHIGFYSNISGSWQQDDIHYTGEISRNEAGLVSLFHFNNSTEDAVTSLPNPSTNIAFSKNSQFGMSAYLSGYNNSITASNATSRFNITDELTIEAWVYPTDIAPWDYIVSKAWDVNASPYINYALGFYNDTKTISFAVTIAGQQHMVTTGQISPLQWYHVVGTYSSSSGEMKIYLNGQIVESAAASGSLDTTATDLIIGGYQYSEEESWNGYIDELAIYNRALGAEEIASHYAVNSREVTAEFPVHISEESTFQWNCEAEDITGNSATAATNKSLTTEITSDDIADTRQTVYEDGEDGTISGWDIYASDPAGASIKNVFDSDKQSRVIEVSSDDIQNVFRLRNKDLSNWQNTSQFIAKWSMKFTASYFIFLNVETTAGQRFIYYNPADYDLLGTRELVHHGLGSNTTNGEWITITRNLQQDLQEAQPGVVILEVNAMWIMGNGQIDDISLLTP